MLIQFAVLVLSKRCKSVCYLKIANGLTSTIQMPTVRRYIGTQMDTSIWLRKPLTIADLSLRLNTLKDMSYQNTKHLEGMMYD